MRLRPLFHSRTLTAVCLALVPVGCALGLLSGWFHVEKYRTEAVHGMSVLSFRYAASLFGLLPLGAFLVRLHQATGSVLAGIQSWLPLRAFVYFVFLALFATTIADVSGLFEQSRWLVARFFENALLACLGLWALLVLTRPALFLRQPTGVLRLLDIALANGVIILLLMEGSVSLWARYSSSRLSVDIFSTESILEKLRKEPHFRYFNFTFNSRGYHDTEFFRATEDDFVVALLADSFGVGIVPYDYNFATIAERRLRGTLGDRYGRVAVHNFGVPGIGMAEYAYLLDQEVLDTNPARLVLCVFVGNDIDGLGHGSRMRQSFLDWWVWDVTKRTLFFWLAKRERGAVGEIGAPVRPGGALPAYIHDPSKEPPSDSESIFLFVESRRFEVLNVRNRSVQKRYRAFFEALDMFQSRLGDRLLVVLIPDVFQVDDDLYRRILETKERPESYERDLPQQRIRAYAKEKGILVLDLLAALREAQADGRTYHLRNTHWNARGNRVAGQQIADFLMRDPRLGTKPSRIP